MKKIMVTLIGSSLVLFASFASAHDHGHPDRHLIFKNDIHAHVFWEFGPQEGSESRMRVEFKNASDHSSADITAVPELVLWMASMGHGSSPTTVEKVVDAQGSSVIGHYRFSKIFFIMGGDWEVRLNLKKLDGSTRGVQ